MMLECEHGKYGAEDCYDCRPERGNAAGLVSALRRDIAFLEKRLKEAERRLASITKLSTPVGDDWNQHAYLTLEMVNDIAKQNNHMHEWEIYNDQPRVYGCACGDHVTGARLDKADERVRAAFARISKP
jgi:hypothetical protein